MSALLPPPPLKRLYVLLIVFPIDDNIEGGVSLGLDVAAAIDPPDNNDVVGSSTYSPT